jgi:hypothetical protein
MTKEDIIMAIEKTSSATSAATFLGISRYDLYKLSTKYEIPIKKNRGGKGTTKTKKEGNGKFILNEILNGKYPDYKTYHLKNRLWAEGIKENKCEICGISDWNGKQLNCELDHINGNPKDHRLENLRILCPNCHSQTDTFCGKNIKQN